MITQNLQLMQVNHHRTLDKSIAELSTKIQNSFKRKDPVNLTIMRMLEDELPAMTSSSRPQVIRGISTRETLSSNSSTHSGIGPDERKVSSVSSQPPLPPYPGAGYVSHSQVPPTEHSDSDIVPIQMIREHELPFRQFSIDSANQENFTGIEFHSPTSDPTHIILPPRYPAKQSAPAFSGETQHSKVAVSSGSSRSGASRKSSIDSNQDATAKPLLTKQNSRSSNTSTGSNLFSHLNSLCMTKEKEGYSYVVSHQFDNDGKPLHTLNEISSE